jgi:hypothetical protein
MAGLWYPLAVAGVTLVIMVAIMPETVGWPLRSTVAPPMLFGCWRRPVVTDSSNKKADGPPVAAPQSQGLQTGSPKGHGAAAAAGPAQDVGVVV